MSEPHVVSWRAYLAVFAALVVLTGVTVLVTGFDFGPLNLIVALGVPRSVLALTIAALALAAAIAQAKATLRVGLQVAGFGKQRAARE